MRHHSTVSLIQGWAPPPEADEEPRTAACPPVRRPASTEPRPRSSAFAFPASDSTAASRADFSLHLDLPDDRLATDPIHQDEDAPLVFPKPGEVVGGFRLISELGRGAFARVYLAEQVALAHRLVALKVSRAEGDEPQILARLQHTHIVPIHSVHDDPATGLRLLCMPYLGGANLAHVLNAAGDRLPSLVSGRSLVDALDRVGHKVASQPASSRARLWSQRAGSTVDFAHGLGTPPVAGAATRGLRPSLVRSLWGRYWARLPWARRFENAPDPCDDNEPAQPARRYLRQASYIQAAVWIGARLAEALEHAHARGLLHHDLKPSNILIAADGTPMLLDFNLSAEAEPKPTDGGNALVGGTLPYMAPEHLDAFHPLGTTPPEAVDERSDLYSLGLILFEMITGHHPFSDPPAGMRLSDVLDHLRIERLRGAPSLRAANPLVPWSLDAILQKCLDPDPNRRYARAGDLAEDLRRFLDDRPLLFAPEPSLRERARKWARRHPRACSSSSIALVAATLIVAVGGVVWFLAETLRNAGAQFQRSAFHDAFNECQLLLNTTSGPPEHLARGIARARAALATYDVGRRPDWLQSDPLRRLAPRQRRALLEEMVEVALLLARAEVYQAEQSGSEPRRRRALEEALGWLDQAERFDPQPSPVLYTDRARYLAALGEASAAAQARAQAAAIPPRTARDYYLLGTSALARRRAEEAEPLLQKAVALDPRRFWAWFVLGLCHADQGRPLDAAGDFNACTALVPGFAWPYLNRGLALARAGRLAEARLCYDRALTLNPDFVEALVDRALTCLELGEAAQAAADLDQAAKLGHRAPALLAARAEAEARLGHRAEARRQFDALIAAAPQNPTFLVARGFFHLTDPKSSSHILAKADFRKALKLDPQNLRAHLGLAYLDRHTDPKAALHAVDQILDRDPDCADARELRALLRARLGDLDALGDIDRLLQAPTPHRLYNSACALSLLTRSHPDVPRLATRAVGFLQRALAAGYPPASLTTDPDLSPLRSLAEFRALLESNPSPR
jgi:serine/threonine protein kinase/Tfp pilus assembly protein PilF